MEAPPVVVVDAPPNNNENGAENNNVNMAMRNDDWERRVEPHGGIRIYLKFIGIMACGFLLYRSRCYYVSDTLVNLRCYLVPLDGDACHNSEPPTMFEKITFAIHISLYVLVPCLSIIAQLHHFLISLIPAAWQRLPKDTFCHWHRMCYFSLYHEMFLAIGEAVSNMLLVNAVNPVNPAFSNEGVGYYIMSSFRALFAFMMLFQFPIYARQTMLEERHCARQRQLFLHNQDE